MLLLIFVHYSTTLYSTKCASVEPTAQIQLGRDFVFLPFLRHDPPGLLRTTYSSSETTVAGRLRHHAVHATIHATCGRRAGLLWGLGEQKSALAKDGTVLFRLLG